jgi:IS605 OrfB family transposase
MSEKLIKTLQVRVKDKHSALLTAMAANVNTVWNFANETSQKAIQDRARFLSGIDLQKLAAGYTHCDGVLIISSTIDMVCHEYARKRTQFRRKRLKWRVSSRKSSGYSLGWIPLRSDSIRYKNGQIIYAGHRFSLWDSYGLAAYKFRAGSFSQDARGRWYFNVCVETAAAKSAGTKAVGIDLGLKTAVTTSDGKTFTGRLYRASEARLAKAQRAGKKRQVRTIHAKIKNQRKDGLHKFSTALVKENAAIFVGDVSSKKLIKTKMAKSVTDAGWAMFKDMLENKCRQAGVVFGVVNEAYSTQTCSQCGSIEGPRGVAGLGIRRWRCSCGVEHDRDVNAAQNIARIGLDSLVVGAASRRAEKPISLCGGGHQ